MKNNELIKKAGIVINSTDIIKFLEDNVFNKEDIYEDEEE